MGGTHSVRGAPYRKTQKKGSAENTFSTLPACFLSHGLWEKRRLLLHFFKIGIDDIVIVLAGLAAAGST